MPKNYLTGLGSKTESALSAFSTSLQCIWWRHSLGHRSLLPYASVSDMHAGVQQWSGMKGQTTTMSHHRGSCQAGHASCSGLPFEKGCPLRQKPSRHAWCFALAGLMRIGQGGWTVGTSSLGYEASPRPNIFKGGRDATSRQSSKSNSFYNMTKTRY